MACFAYKGLAPGGDVLDGQVIADTQESVTLRLRAKGIVPLKIEQIAEARRKAPNGGLFARTKKVTVKDQMLFTRELSVLLRAGVLLEKALLTLDRIMVAGPMAGVPAALVADIKGGASLEGAMRKLPHIFPAYYIGMIRAGEAGGALATILERLAVMLERNEALNANVRSALVYPMLVLAMTGLSLIILMVLVIPEFRAIFEDAGGELPLLTKIVLAASDLTIKWGWLLLILMAGAALFIKRAASAGPGRLFLDNWLLRMPLAGDTIRRIETARFCRSLGTLRANGVGLIEAISIAAGTLTNRAIAKAAAGIAGPLAKGAGLARPMRDTGVFPDLAAQLVEVGEESGQLDAMLIQVADVYDREAASSIQRMLALLSPAVTVFLGLLIALIIGSILSAILGSYDLAL
jgi:general secretion pathway protein F